MNLNFFGSTVSCYTENGVLTIGIGNDAVDPTHFVIIARLDEDEDEDDDDDDDSNEQEDETKSSGNFTENNIGIQTNFSRFESEAAISRISITGTHMQILIKSEKIDELGAQQIDINLIQDDSTLNELVRYLHQIFDDTTVELLINV